MHFYREYGCDTLITEKKYLKLKEKEEANIKEEFKDIEPEETDFFDCYLYQYYTTYEVWNFTEEEKEKLWKRYLDDLINQELENWEENWEQFWLEEEEEEE